jgi:hypothetical protein
MNPCQPAKSDSSASPTLEGIVLAFRHNTTHQRRGRCRCVSFDPSPNANPSIQLKNPAEEPSSQLKGPLEMGSRMHLSVCDKP